MSSKKQTMIEVPPSTEYIILDVRGGVLAKDLCPALATRRARTELEDAVAVVGSPSGVLLAHIVRGPTDTRPALRAQAAWKEKRREREASDAETRGPTVPEPPNGDPPEERLRQESAQALETESAERVQAKRDRKNARRREKREAETRGPPNGDPPEGRLRRESVPALEASGIESVGVEEIACPIAGPFGLQLDFGLERLRALLPQTPFGLARFACAPLLAPRSAMEAPRLHRTLGAATPESQERLARAAARRARKNARRREKRRLTREAKAPGSMAPDTGRESGVRVVGESLEERKIVAESS